MRREEKSENKTRRLKYSRVSGARSSESFIARDTSDISCPAPCRDGEFRERDLRRPDLGIRGRFAQRRVARIIPSNVRKLPRRNARAA